MKEFLIELGYTTVFGIAFVIVIATLTMMLKCLIDKDDL